MTKDDLTKLGILLDNRLDSKLMPIIQDMDSIKNSVLSIQNNMTTIQWDISTAAKDIKKIRQDQNSIIKFFDEEFLELRTRVENLENILKTVAPQYFNES